MPNSSTGPAGVTSDSRLSPTAVTPQKLLPSVSLTRGGDDTTNGRKGFWRGDRRRSSMSAGSSTHAWHDLVGDGPVEARKSRFVVAGLTLRRKDPPWDWGNPRSLFYLATGPARHQRGHETYPRAAPGPAVCFVSRCLPVVRVRYWILGRAGELGCSALSGGKGSRTLPQSVAS